MENKKNLILIIIVCLVILVGLLIYNSKKSNIKEPIVSNENKVILLEDYSRFFTVNSCIYKYITYLQSKDVDSIFKVLNKDYVKINSIDSNTLFNYVEQLNGNYSFTSKKIYYKNINDNVLKYYVYGYLTLDTIDSIADKSERYYIVTFDVENQLFDITPFDKVSFEEVLSE